MKSVGGRINQFRRRRLTKIILKNLQKQNYDEMCLNLPDQIFYEVF